MIPQMSRRVWAAVLAAAGLQTAVLGYLVADRVNLLTNGREIVAEVVPVDPRDLFRGDYVVLGYTFTAARSSTLPPGARTGDAVYATLAEDGPKKWQVREVTAQYPQTVPPGAVVLKGRVDYVVPGATGNAPPTGGIRYGIESYFVPEGTGRVLETQVREKQIDAVLAVGSDGGVAIKALRVGEERVVEEPAL